jgi:hypothetical protein
MPKKVISYKLNLDGTIPDYVEDGGYLTKDSNDTANMIAMGISKDGADISGAEAEFATELEAFTWVSSYLSDHTTMSSTGQEISFVVADAVSDLFAKLN